MKYLILIIKILISALNSILPFGLILRNWKFHDMRTKKYHQITLIILFTWLITGLLCTGVIWYETIESNELKGKIEELLKSSKKSNENSQKIISQNEELKIAIIEKNKEIGRLKQGITSSYYFNGQVRSAEGSDITMENGQYSIYQKLKDLESKKDFKSLIALCKQEIEKTPHWITINYYLGCAYANTGFLNEAIKNFEYFINNAPDTHTYDNPKEKAKEFINLIKTKIKTIN